MEVKTLFLQVSLRLFLVVGRILLRVNKQGVGKRGYSGTWLLSDVIVFVYDFREWISVK